MSDFTGIDVSKLPAPDAVEVLDYETILAELVAFFRTTFPEFSAITVSDPAYKVIVVMAYYAMVLTQRTNDKTKQNMLAFATGSNLDHLGANLLVTRKVLVPADPLTNTSAVMEDDEEFRRRIQMAPEAYTTAGSSGSYIFHALSAHPDILDAAVVSPAPRIVIVTVLSRVGNGAPSAEAIAAVENVLSGATKRPLTDLPTISGVGVVEYTITAIIHTFDGPDSSLVIAASTASGNAMVAKAKRIGRDVPLSAIYAALHVDGVRRVELLSPIADVVVADDEVAHCVAVNITHGGYDE